MPNISSVAHAISEMEQPQVRELVAGIVDNLGPAAPNWNKLKAEMTRALKEAGEDSFSAAFSDTAKQALGSEAEKHADVFVKQLAASSEHNPGWASILRLAEEPDGRVVLKGQEELKTAIAELFPEYGTNFHDTIAEWIEISKTSEMLERGGIDSKVFWKAIQLDFLTKEITKKQARITHITDQTAGAREEVDRLKAVYERNFGKPFSITDPHPDTPGQ